MRNLFGISVPFAVGLAALALASFAAHADMRSEVVTARTHAGLAASASDLAGTHSHLHHALNCLVGPGGEGFDNKELNPCAQSGRGAITDAADSNTKKSLMAAADKAEAGIAAGDLKTAQKDAAETAAMLKAMK